MKQIKSPETEKILILVQCHVRLHERLHDLNYYIRRRSLRSYWNPKVALSSISTTDQFEKSNLGCWQVSCKVICQLIQGVWGCESFSKF